MQTLPDEHAKARLYDQARQFYDERLRDELEPHHNGKFVAIDPEARLFAVSADAMAAAEELRRAGGLGWKILLRVGQEWTFDLLREP